VELGPSYDVDFPLVKLQKNPVPLQAPRRIAVEEGDCVVPPPLQFALSLEVPELLGKVSQFLYPLFLTLHIFPLYALG
jgi:hypothetical protein